MLGALAGAGAQPATAAAFRGGPSGGRLDTSGLALVALGVLALMAVAAYLPARRASRISPVDALCAD